MILPEGWMFEGSVKAGGNQGIDLVFSHSAWKTAR
jgi:hypothetical protein